MNLLLKLEDAGGVRTVEPEELPLALGGLSAGLELPGVTTQEAVAWIDVSDQDIFVKAGKTGIAISCNGVPVSASQWLRDGDRLQIGPCRITLEHAGSSAMLRVEQHKAAANDGPSISVVTVPAPDTTAGPGNRIHPIDFTPQKLASPTRSRRTRPLLWVGVLAVAAFAIAGWFLLTARSVEISVEPAPDQVSLHGGLSSLHLGERYLLLPGTYQLQASRDGYQSLDVSLEVTEEHEQSLRFTLEKLAGFLVVDATPVERARIVIDGEAAGLSGESLQVPAGTHQLLVLADRHLDYREEISIDGGGAHQTLAVELTPGWAEVSFDSRPAGATVSASGTSVGTTPFTADLDPGSHEIEFRLSGHKPYFGQVTAVANQATSFPTVELALEDIGLTVESIPSGANITVNGHYHGQTPIHVELPPGITHEVQASKSGHEPEARSIELLPGEAQSMRFTLAERQGDVELLVQPDGVEVFVNGEPQGEARGILKLPSAPQSLEFRKSGFETQRTTVTPRPDLPQVIRITLEREAPPTPTEPPAMLASSEGQTMVLIPAGRFLMGASRREPGRRANETLHEVELTRPFYLGRREVSNGEFRRFHAEHRSGALGGFSLDAEDQPVVQITWEEAALYCNWLSEQESLPLAYRMVEERLMAVRPPNQGYRLPLAAEWSWAARYSGNPGASKYIWGNSLPVPPGAANFADQAAVSLLSRTLSGYDDSFPVTAPVESMAPNGLGLFHLGGNVAEWVHDVYGIHPSYQQEVVSDPTGPTEGELHVIRGASWMDSTVSELRLTYRDYGSKARPDVGFRIARTAGGTP